MNIVKLETGELGVVGSVTSSAGAGDSGKIPRLDSFGQLDASFIKGATTSVIVAGANLSAGAFVNVYDDSGTPKIRSARSESGFLPPHGFILDTVTAGNSVTVYFSGINTEVAGLTPGATYWMSYAGISSTYPTTGGFHEYAHQVGVALSATKLAFQPKLSIKL